MKYIDMSNWKRRDHFNYFRNLDYPHFNICANLDITNFYNYIKENKLPFFISVLYASTKTANGIQEFRLRIREDKLIEHEIVHPSFTIMTEGEVFNFCDAKFIENYTDFKDNTLKEIEKAKLNTCLKNDKKRDDLLYTTSIPWISFTSISHPINTNTTDSIPRIAWGKFFNENGKVKLPFSVQAHHAVVDGVHAGHFFNIIQEMFNNPTKYFF
ncbi:MULTISPECIES: CatA-like O-acetyltransferase [Clostridium]|uniref:Chloramphenicol acetyltransferase n=1 Tax=Clostridium acetobutylicum (strain ATCC 824 / DSM 792 / JCM 1419 / IAM 19013 / LMG 5710 / NBRC 13948 / NRRL B-527 / VKM B-1787 / 2291 / W) TaxID=272562 RepID=Q97MG3_CLOAB|nr:MULTISPECIES: CatA-like O-acetyltransferase [Clostridium]AAK78216.1 Chloramphenicol acetyltransferase [Clostridium acetobutylicum ATCC 824]ADZ19282.1 Chloramphenicol acetyltransferase [Clostridium acetobutylicum EA 2018]AEI33195.1 chloramphenicol acetyltransferase [Clostridium acetobutylicum DSM 1731]AWV82024.1 chloramphenicol acetyltransferase [Clostridium acetobutylicum]MBC2396070.1 chloramphenicol acetyltransferase [Clostridium acetobutylicum]